MAHVTCGLAGSADGFVADPRQSLADPLTRSTYRVLPVRVSTCGSDRRYRAASVR